MTTTAMNIATSTPDSRQMVRRLYVDGLPPDLFHQRRRSSTIRPAAEARRKGRERPNESEVHWDCRGLRPNSNTALLASGSPKAQDPPGGPRDRAYRAYLQFLFFMFLLLNAFQRAREMPPRVDLFQAGMQGWARLNPQQRERFFQAGLKAALRLDRLEFRAWLLRRVRTAPLCAPIDPGRYAISDDMAALLKQLPLRADDADGGTGL
jgi:hypothetical protein